MQKRVELWPMVQYIRRLCCARQTTKTAWLTHQMTQKSGGNRWRTIFLHTIAVQYNARARTISIKLYDFRVPAYCNRHSYSDYWVSHQRLTSRVTIPVKCLAPENVLGRAWTRCKVNQRKNDKSTEKGQTDELVKSVRRCACRLTFFLKMELLAELPD